MKHPSETPPEDYKEKTFVLFTRAGEKITTYIAERMEQHGDLCVLFSRTYPYWDEHVIWYHLGTGTELAE